MEDTSQILVSTYSGDQAENKKTKILTKKTARLILKGIGIALILIWTLLPIYWMCSLAIRSNAELGSSLGFLPKSFTMAHFTELIIKNRFFMSIKNSLIVSVVALVISMVTGISCSYVFSRVRYRYRLKGLELFIVLLIRYLYYTTLKEATEQSAVRPRTPLWSEVEQAYGIELSNALAGTKTVDDALKDAKTAIEKIMK